MRNAFLLSDIERLHPLVTAWRDVDVVRAQRGVALDRELHRCQDAVFGEAFARSCPLEGIPAAAYLQRVVTCPAGRYLAGVRFRVLDLNFPFVDLLAMESGADLAGILASIRDEWNVFSPRCVRLYASEAPGSKWAADQWVYAGQVASVARPSRNVEPVTVDTALELVRAGYAVLPADLQPLVHASDEEDLTRCIEGGHLLGIRHQGTWAGLLAVERAADFGVSGFSVVESVVHPEHRGHGLAGHLQGACAARIQQLEPNAVLFGTIAAENRASQRAAERAGRVRLGAYFWRDFD